jgi:hypothetical protein
VCSISACDQASTGGSSILNVYASKAIAINRHLLSSGSVGKPRDGDPRASYMLVDLNDGDIEVMYRRVEYEIEVVAARIRRFGVKFYPNNGD